MKHLIHLILLLLLAAPCAFAQGSTAGEGDSIATSIPWDIEIPLENTKKVKYAWTVTITGRSEGTVSASVDASSITITGDIESLGAASAVFDVICARSIAAAVARGGATCTTSGTAYVSVPSCVTRTATGYAAYGSGVVTRTYSYSCSTTGTVATLTSTAGTSTCSSPAVTTTIAPAGTIQ